MSRCIRPVLYVSGPVTGIEGDNVGAFAEAAARLRAGGYRTHIPHEDVRPGTAWPSAMRTCLVSMLAQADGLALLPGWEKSRGAQLEAHVARSLGMKVMEINDWISAKEAMNHDQAR